MFIFKFILVVSLFILCHSNETTTAPTMTTMPTSINVNEEVQKAEAFNKAMTDMLEVLSSDQPLGKNLKKLLDASRICGLVFHQGIYSWNQLESNQEIRNVSENIARLHFHIRNFDFQITKSEEILSSRHNINSIQKEIILPIQTLIKLFITFGIDSATSVFNSQNIDDLKTGCRWYDPEKILDSMRNEMLPKFRSLIVEGEYSDKTFKNLKTVFQLSFKETLLMFPFCHIFLNRTWRSPNRAFLATDTLKMFHTTFNKINAFRKDNYWKNEVIQKFIGKYVLNGPDKSIFTKSEMEKQSQIYKIQKSINRDLFDSYDSLGYYFHVTVNNAAQLGHNDTVLQCSTECRYLYNFLGKDIYVIRTLKAKNNNYSTCQFLEKFQPFYGYCRSEINATDSLEPLAKKIAEKCGDKVVAFSLIRSRLGVKDDIYYQNKGGFLWLCDNDVSILLAFKPL